MGVPFAGTRFCEKNGKQIIKVVPNGELKKFDPKLVKPEYNVKVSIQLAIFLEHDYVYCTSLSV